MQKALLCLADGTIFEGLSPAWQQQNQSGETVFNTGMTGYIESLTDPSYHDQILVFTYPLIGNYGVQPDWGESEKIQASGMVVSEVATGWSHTGADRSLLEWLKEENIPLISGVDTRALTRHLRSYGTMQGVISRQPAKPTARPFLPGDVSIDEPQIYNKGQKKKIILVDCGAKENIVRSFLKFPLEIKRVPYDYDYTNEPYDGVFLSNGPADPMDYQATVTVLKKAIKVGKPIFGICLGSQLMGLAAGARTYKLPFGHRGHNQPCQQASDGRCYITSQNHGYAVDEKTLPKSWAVSFRNLNDGSVEGIKHISKPFFSVQFHPEACPGPTDTAWLFQEFYKYL